MRKILIYDHANIHECIKDTTLIMHPDREISFAQLQPLYLTFYKENEFLALGNYIDDGEKQGFLYRPDSLGNIISCFGEYPEYPKVDKGYQNYGHLYLTIFSPQIVCNGNRLAVIYGYTDLIDIYDIEQEKLIHRIHGPSGVYAAYKAGMGEHGLISCFAERICYDI